MRYVRKALSMPPHKLAARVYYRLSYQFKRDFTRWRDARFSTYKTARFTSGVLRYVIPPTVEALEPHREVILALANLYCDHYFDLLGSGWVQVKHGMACMGVEGHKYTMERATGAAVTPANAAYAQRVQSLIDKNYTPIDWHLDFKSGFRWSELAPSNTLKYGDKLGVDVKVPWELARAQHFPMLAYAYALTKDERYVREFRNQILDFIATNPPRYGVNWIVAMDVGIRAANWLVAYDMFRGYGATFDTTFEQEFIQSIYQHGHHIRHHLEWSPTLRSNHYLSDIVGLLFCAAYLPQTHETDEWLLFSTKELVKEFDLQFGKDGANFEASTSYHRLSAELVIYALALMTAMSTSEGKLSGSRLLLTMLPKDLWERVENMAEFTMHLTRPDGRLTQIGDNDSGRLFKLHPTYIKMTVAEAKRKYTQLANYNALPNDAVYWDENFLDHRHIVAAINGHFYREDLHTFSGDCLDEQIIKSLMRNLRTEYHPLRFSRQIAEKVRIGEQLPTIEGHMQTVAFSGDSLREGLACYGYPDFGVYIFRSKRLYMTVRCGSVGQRGNGGHAHSDQLSIELLIDGEPLIQDPGTYLYTPLPERRNQYRSQNVHAAPQLEREPANFSILFQMPDAFHAKCLYFGEQGFAGTIQVSGQTVTRRIAILDDRIEITDSGGNGFVPKSVPMSNGYGKQLADEQSVNPKLQSMLK